MVRFVLREWGRATSAGALLLAILAGPMGPAALAQTSPAPEAKPEAAPPEPAKSEEPKPPPPVPAPQPVATPEPVPKPVEAVPRPVEATAKPAEPAPKAPEPSAKPVETESKPVEAAPKPVEVAPKPAEPKPAVAATKPEQLRIATFSGAYRQAQDKSLFAPFALKSGRKLALAPVETDSAKLLAALGSSNPPWDVAEVPLAVASAACKDGVLAPIEAARLAPAADGKPVSEDFIEGALLPCGVASVAWSSVVIFDVVPGRKVEPKRIADLFDVARFPGNRALPQGPRYLLEAALLADGVAPADVYAQLRTEDGLARAFRQLDKIRDHIVWWDRPQAALEFVRSKRAAFALAFNGRVFQETAVSGRALGVIWDGQVYDLNVWVVPKSAAARAEAVEFIAYATEPARLAAQASLFPYGPARKSALALVGQHPALKIPMRAHLPTASENLAGALRIDSLFWVEHETRLKERFAAWMRGETR